MKLLMLTHMNILSSTYIMVHKKVKEPRVDYELIYAYVKFDWFGDIVEFINSTKHLHLVDCW